MHIRKARPAEASALSALALRSKAYWGYSREFMEACRDELTFTAHDIESWQVCVVEIDDDAVGFYALRPSRNGEAELEALFVDPDFLGRGYGRALLDHAKHATREMGLHRMIVQGDPNAQSFYLATGGRFVGMRPSGSIPGRQLPIFRFRVQ